MSDPYIYEQIDYFSSNGLPIIVMDLDTILPRYEEELRSRGLEYIAVKGIDVQAVRCSIIHPEDMIVYRNMLVGAIERDEQILRRRRAGLKELESDMAKYDKGDSR